MKKFINDVALVEEQMIQGMVKAYPQYLRKLDCGNVVVRAHKKEGKVALISGGGSGHEPAHGGFVGTGMLTCGEVGAGKAESPEIYERAMRRLQSNKQNTVVFEDALHAIQTAKQAGFRVCAVYDPSAESDQAEIQALADTYIRSFEELTEVHPAQAPGGALGQNPASL